MAGPIAAFPAHLQIGSIGDFSMRRIALCLVILLLPFVSVSQTSDSKSCGTPPEKASATPDLSQQPVDASNFTSAKGFVLEDSVPVKLRINRTISSADSKTGDTVDFEVLQEISVNGTLVIPKGGLAYATITEAQAKRRMARGGKLGVNIDYVKLASSEKAPLRAVKELKGGGHTGAMTAGIVATGIVFFPAAPFFLFMHGKDITIPKGTEITAYVNGDMKLDVAKFQQAAPRPESQPSQVVSSPGPTRLQLESNPSGADIEIDGNFVGSTPSAVEVSEGDHAVTVKKSGFKDWERKLKVSNGSSVHLTAELEKVETP
jgi:hypothetical protein